MPTCPEVKLLTLDCFGNRRLPSSTIFALADLAEGATLPINTDQIRSTLMASGHFAFVDVFLWRGTPQHDCRGQLFIDVIDKGEPLPPPFRPTPSGHITLPAVFATLRAAYDVEFDNYISLPDVERGKYKVDESQGHYRIAWPPLRAIEDQLLASLPGQTDLLISCLKDDSRPDQRATAAFALGWAADKRQIVQPLVDAMRDADTSVRDWSARALSPIIRFLWCTEHTLAMDPDPAFELFLRPSVLDRNKAAGILAALAIDPLIARRLRRELKDRFFALAATKLYIQRRIVMYGLRHLFGPRPLTYAEATTWLTTHLPEELPWWTRPDMIATWQRYYSDNPCGD